MKVPNATWKKVREHIMMWAQEDGTADDFSDVLTGGTEDGPTQEQWVEFEARLRKAFG